MGMVEFEVPGCVVFVSRRQSGHWKSSLACCSPATASFLAYVRVHGFEISCVCTLLPSTFYKEEFLRWFDVLLLDLFLEN